MLTADIRERHTCTSHSHTLSGDQARRHHMAGGAKAHPPAPRPRPPRPRKISEQKYKSSKIFLGLASLALDEYCFREKDKMFLLNFEQFAPFQVSTQLISPFPGSFQPLER